MRRDNLHQPSAVKRTLRVGKVCGLCAVVAKRVPIVQEYQAFAIENVIEIRGALLVTTFQLDARIVHNQLHVS